jgi:hypothetical protein
MFIEALARLNYRLQKEQSDITVVAFIVTNAGTGNNGFVIACLQRLIHML